MNKATGHTGHIQLLLLGECGTKPMGTVDRQDQIPRRLQHGDFGRNPGCLPIMETTVATELEVPQKIVGNMNALGIANY